MDFEITGIVLGELITYKDELFKDNKIKAWEYDAITKFLGFLINDGYEVEE